MKLPLPEDFRASLLVHDGEEDYDGDPDRFAWMPGCDRLVPLAQIVAQWKDQKDHFSDAIGFTDERDHLGEDGPSAPDPVRPMSKTPG
jgi:hypothetical protein